MDYLYCREGLLVTNNDNDPIILEEGHSVVLQDVRGNRLFANEWEYEGGMRDYQRSFIVSEILDNGLVLTCNDFHFVIATQTGLEEPVIVECDGAPYSCSRILTVAFPGDGYINAASFKITANTLPPKKKDNMALAA